MRSSLMVSLLLLAVVIVGGVALSERAAGVSEELEAVSRALLAHTEQGAWETAAELLGQTQTRWEETERTLQMQVIHEDTDNVTLALSAIEAGIRSRSLPMCLWGCNELQEAARHLYHRDAFTLANVL